MTQLPLFPVTMVGSWPRSQELLRAQKRKRTGKISGAAFDELADDQILRLLKIQADIGVDIVTDGEQRRDNFYSFVAEKLNGVKLMTLAEMLDVVEDKAGFEQLLKTLDVPAYSLSNPCCVDRIERKTSLAVDELRFLTRHTDRPIKVPLPGPYLLTRAMFVSEMSRPAYGAKEELAEDVVRILREEIAELLAEGVEFVQFDEPVLTEVAFSPGSTRTFMCASLAAKGDPAEELDFAVSLVNRVLEGFSGVTFGLHICRGNWSQNETILLRGNYGPFQRYLEQMNLNQLVLEYATERAGDVMSFGDKSLGLGVVNPRTTTVEPISEIRDSIENALEFYEPRSALPEPGLRLRHLQQQSRKYGRIGPTENAGNRRCRT